MQVTDEAATRRSMRRLVAVATALHVVSMSTFLTVIISATVMPDHRRALHLVLYGGPLALVPLFVGIALLCVVLAKQRALRRRLKAQRLP